MLFFRMVALYHLEVNKLLTSCMFAALDILLDVFSELEGFPHG